MPAEPEREYEEEERRAAPDNVPLWEPEPYDPERERIEPAEPAMVP
jgi:hypothetical protein